MQICVGRYTRFQLPPAPTRMVRDGKSDCLAPLSNGEMASDLSDTTLNPAPRNRLRLYGVVALGLTLSVALAAALAELGPKFHQGREKAPPPAPAGDQVVVDTRRSSVRTRTQYGLFFEEVQLKRYFASSISFSCLCIKPSGPSKPLSALPYSIPHLCTRSPL